MISFRFALRSAIITCYPLSKNMDEVIQLAVDDEELEKIIHHHREELADNDIETFHSEKNIIITEKGYFCAIWHDIEGNEI